MRHLFCVCVLAFIVPATCLADDDELEINHIRVGQGDATLIIGPKKPDGTRVKILIDAGNMPNAGYDGGRIILAVLHNYRITELDFFIATHYDSDHIGGIVAGSPTMHGQGFVFGWDNAPGKASVDEDGNGRTDWLDSSLTMMRPDPEELGTVIDWAVAG